MALFQTYVVDNNPAAGLERWPFSLFALASEFFLTHLSLLLRRSFRIVTEFISNDEWLIQWNLTAVHLLVGNC